MKGTLSDMSVADLIQIACQEKKSSRLIVENNNQRAEFWFDRGEIVHAISKDQIGEEVVFQVLRWEKGKFNLEAGVAPPTISIARGWSGLLLEGAQRIDEDKHKKGTSIDERSIQKKENKMNIKRLEQIIVDLQEDLGSALVATDIWATKDAQPLAGFNSQPKATALFNEITRYLMKTLKGSGFPNLGTHYTVNLENNSVIVVVIRGDYQEGMLVDLSKTSLGILMNVAIPKVVAGLDEAIK